MVIRLFEVEWNKHDKYQRIVGKVLLDSQDICLEQIKAGMPWHYKKYEMEQTPQDRTRYAAAEYEARAAHRGLWMELTRGPRGSGGKWDSKSSSMADSDPKWTLRKRCASLEMD